MDVILATLFLVSVAALYWTCFMLIDCGKKSSPPSPPPQKGNDPAQQRGELKRIAAVQADKRAKSVIRVNGLTWDDWLHRAILALQELWPGYSYDKAQKMIIEYLDGVKFGDTGYEWSVHAAHEIAQMIVDEYGERYGANQ